MKRFMPKIIVVALVAFLLTGCVPRTKNVVVTSYPVEYLFNRLADGRVNVERLDTGNTPQTSQIREDYNTVLNQADALFYIQELQPYWDLYKDEIEDTKKNIELYDLSDRSALYNFNRFVPVDVSGSRHVVEQPYYDTDNFKAVDTYEKDPFLWMNPLAMTSMARSIKDWLVKEYPDEKGKFEERFTALEIELTNLQAEFQKLRDSEQGIKFVSVNPTYGNWQKNFNIQVYPLILSEYGSLPSEVMLDDIRARIQADGVEYIVFEDGFNEDQQKLFNRIKTELELKEVRLSSLYTLSDDQIEDQTDYIKIMYENLETLESMLR